MSYTWITPKTDWTTTSHFTYNDYNRIRNNLLFINDRINTEMPEKAQDLDLGDPKTGYTNNYFPSEFTAFEDALESFTRVGQDVNIGTRSFYSGNGSFIMADALNRLEECCLRWYSATSIQYTITILNGDIFLKENDTVQLRYEITPTPQQSYTVTWRVSTRCIVSPSNVLSFDPNFEITYDQLLTLSLRAVLNIGSQTVYSSYVQIYPYIKDYITLPYPFGERGVAVATDVSKSLHIIGSEINNVRNANHYRWLFGGSNGRNEQWEHLDDLPQNVYNARFTTQDNLRSFAIIGGSPLIAEGSNLIISVSAPDDGSTPTVHTSTVPNATTMGTMSRYSNLVAYAVIGGVNPIDEDAFGGARGFYRADYPYAQLGVLPKSMTYPWAVYCREKLHVFYGEEHYSWTSTEGWIRLRDTPVFVNYQDVYTRLMVTAISQERIFLIKGSIGSSYYVYNNDNDTWEEIGKLPCNAYSGNIVRMGMYLWYVGGEGHNGEMHILKETAKYLR